MENLTVVVPFWNGQRTIHRLLDSLPADQDVLVVADAGSARPEGVHDVLALEERGYFSGACNAGFSACNTDVLILNQDVWLDDGWQDIIAENRARYGIIGDGVFGHPAWPKGYAQGTFMFIRRDVLDTVGGFNAELYPLWGSTAEYQARACRHGFEALPLKSPRWLHHEERERFGSAITTALEQEPHRKQEFIRTPPEVSVVIPCYNYGRYLRECVGSVLAQTFQSFEIVIVDDASTDGSEKIAVALADPWQGIRALQHSRNAGTAVTLNTGVKAAYGKYIYILSADDKLEPWALEKLYREVIKLPHGFVYGNMQYFNGGERSPVVLPSYDFDKLIYKNHIPANIMYPKRAWQEAGGYPAIMTDGREDWAFAVALGRAGWCGQHIGKSGALIRREGQNRTKRTAHYGRGYFLSKIKSLFPDVYEGVKPMACCGNRRTNVTRVVAPKSASPQTADDVRLMYTGGNVGTEVVYGPSGRHYKYGRSARRIYVWVAPEDVAFMLQTHLFRKAPLPAVKVTEAIADETVDPGALSVSALKALDPATFNVKAVLAAEVNGKARKSAIAYLESLL